MTILRKFKIGLSAFAVVSLMLAASWAFALDRLEVVETDGNIQWAKIDPALRGLEDQNRVTVRALRAFGRLPEPYSRLVLDLRKDGVDLLAAGPKEIQELVAKAESGSLKTDPKLLRDLLSFLENREYHGWTALQAGEGLELGPDTMLRGQGLVTLRDAAGQTRVLEHAGDATPLVTVWAATAASDPATVSPKPEISGAEQGATAKGSADASGAEKPGTPGKAVQKDWPRTWGKAPGMRLFGLNVDDVEVDANWSEYAALCPAPDGGFLAAASVDTPAGLQTWAVRYDAQGVPLWSRTLGGPFDMLVTSATALEDKTFLLGGILSKDQPGFLLALDDRGEVLWSQTPDQAWKEHGGKDMIWTVASSGKDIVAAGHVIKTDENRAVLLSVPAGGGTGWRTEFTDGLEASVVLPVADGWVVGGSSLEEKPWLAKVSAQGQVLWSKTYGTNQGWIAALVQTPAGEILAAGNGPMWRVLGQDGELLREVALNPSFDGVQAVHSVQGMALADGELWLAGMTESEDGWLAKTDLAGQPQWLQFYGQDGEDALKAVLPGASGAVAVGRSFSPGGAMWLVQVDGAGTPLSAEEKVTALESLIGIGGLMGESQGLSALHVTRTKDSLRLAVPFVVAADGLPGFSGYPADLGLLSFQGKPAGAPGRWNMTAELPDRILLRGKNGLDAGVLVTDSQKLSFVFDENLATALALDMDLKSLRIEPLENSPLHGLYTDLGLEERPEALDQASVARLTAHLKLDQAKNGRWKGPLNVEVKDWQRIHGEKKVGELKKLQVKGQYEELDLAANEALIRKVENMVAEEPSSADFSDLIQLYTQSMGAGHGELALTGFFLADASSEGSLAIKEITASGDMKIPEPDSQLRNMQAVYTVKGVDAQLGSNNVTVSQVSAGLALERFNFASIGQVAAQAAAEAEGNEEASWQSALSKVLGGVDMRFGVDNLQVVMSGQPPMKLDQADLRLALSGLDTPLTGLTLTYDHKGAAGIPMVPAEVLPTSARFDLALENLPVPALLADSMAALDNPMAALSALAAHATKLQIKALNVDAPLGGLLCTAEGAFEEGQDQTSPMGRLRAAIKVRGLMDVVRWIANMQGESGQEILNMGQALEKVGQPAGDMLQYNVDADTSLQVRINGQSLEQVFGGGEETPTQ